MSRRVAIVQSNYIPWKGYFDLINSVDEFILYDDVQYTKRDWRNRNRIKTRHGLLWLTIPVEVKGKFSQRVNEVRVHGDAWASEHWKTIRHNYSPSPHFARYETTLARLYGTLDTNSLSEINHRFLTAICDLLGIHTRISQSSDYELVGGRTERLVHLCQQAGGREYLTGPSAKAYLKEDLFAREGIRVVYMDYSGYPEYRQRFSPFEHAVSVIDLIFNEGPNAPRYMRSFSHEPVCGDDPVSISSVPEGVLPAHACSARADHL